MGRQAHIRINAEPIDIGATPRGWFRLSGFSAATPGSDGNAGVVNRRWAVLLQIVLFRFLQSRNRFVRILKVARTSTELWVPRRVSMFEYQDFVFRAPVLDFIPRVLHRLFIKLASSAECQQFLVPQLH